MLENRDYMRRTPEGFRWSATLVLVVTNILAFILQKTVMPHRFEAIYLDLSADGLRNGFVLLTFQFLHGGYLHIIFNCWALYVFGREVESILGRPLFLGLYFCSGVFGGLLHAFSAFVWPHYFDVPVVGASAGIFGVVAAFAMLFPERRLTMLVYFVLPIKLRARTLLLAELLITGLGIAFPDSEFMLATFGNMAHVAHLGGILTGLAFIRLREELQQSH
jgi:rhomboid protease GluP